MPEHPWLPREYLEQEQEAHEATREDLSALRAEYRRIYGLLQVAVDRNNAANDRIEKLTQEITDIRIALGRVAVYKDIIEYSPTVLAVDNLVRDHQELEARIDAVMHLLAFERESRNVTTTDIEIARLLQGGTRVPDDISDIEGD